MRKLGSTRAETPRRLSQKPARVANKSIEGATPARPAAAAVRAALPPAASLNGHIVDLDRCFNLRNGPGYYNEVAKAALLRRRRVPPHDELVVDFSGPEVIVQLRASGSDVIRGPWTWQATAGGKPITAAGPWKEVCWHTDFDGDYLEIEQDLAGGWSVQRQMFLAREDRFLFLADALLSPQPDSSSGNAGQGAVGNALRGVPSDGANELRFTTSLPLSAPVGFQPMAETREGRLSFGRVTKATALPLALPEWNAEFSHGRLAAGDGKLNLELAAAGQRLYAPLFIDLDPARHKQPLTWRRLTVAESLRVVGRDEAVGYRVQIGRQQWLIYRSLAPIGNRTVLGQNTVADFFLHRFLPNGTTEALVIVE
jgi:hypothetical protein